MKIQPTHITSYLYVSDDIKMLKSIAFITLSVAATAIELTPDNWDTETAGKTVFLKMYAPWCGHCKAMKPAWDSLMEEFSSSDDVLIADVDCIGAGKPLCDQSGVKGFPAVKWGAPDNLQDYKGGRDLVSLQSFAEELKPPCDVTSFENCNEAQQTLIGELKQIPEAELDEKIAEYEGTMEKIKTDFEKAVQELQTSYSLLSTKKETDIAELKSSVNIVILQSLKKTFEPKVEL